MRADFLDRLEHRLCLASVSGYVYNDINSNGLKETGESALPLPGITAYLDLNTNGQLDEGEPRQLTSVRQGKFEFNQVPAGSYSVRLVLTDRFRMTDPGENGSREVTVGEDTNGTVDPFGVYTKPRVSGFVYGDANRNGTREIGENNLLPGQTVYIDANGNSSLDDGERKFLTQSDGFWFDLDEGTYTIRLATKTGWRQTQPTENGGYTITIPNANEIPRLLFGTYEQTTEQTKARIYGQVWNDLNGNGAHVDGEPFVPNARVYIDVNKSGTLDDAEPSTLTNANGAYVFLGLNPGEYTIRQHLEGNWVQTFPAENAGHVVTVAAGQIVEGKNFGRRTVGPSMVSGVVWSDLNSDGIRQDGEPGLVNQTVYIDINKNGQLDPAPSDDKVLKTNASGEWSVALAAGVSYHVRLIVPTGATQTAPADAFYTVTPTAGQNVDGKNFGLHREPEVQRGSISGKYFIDANGNAKLDDGETRLIEKKIFLDANNNNTLDDGEKIATTTAGGEYVFAGLLPGEYHVRAVIPAGFALTTVPANLNLAAGQSIVGINIGIKSNEETRVGSISGVAWADLNADGIRQSTEPLQSGKTIYIDANKNGVLDSTEKRVLTNAEGRYKFVNLAPGNYRVRRVVPNGYRLTAPVIGYYDITLANNQNVVEKNFGTTERSGVAGRVFKDANGDKKFNDGETGLGGWRVYIDKNLNGKFDDGERSTLTFNSGEWVFRELVAGNYRFRVQGKDGWKLTTPLDGFYNVTLASGQLKTGLLFGVKQI